MPALSPKWKRRLTVLLSLIAAMVLLAELEKHMKRQAPECADGQCAVPEGHGLIIDPFPDEIVPESISTNQPGKD